MKHDPTRQHEAMGSFVNEKVSREPKKLELNAQYPKGTEVDQAPVHYSNLVGNVNFKSPRQITQIDGFKSHHGNLETHPSSGNTYGQSDADFSTKQIPNTKPKFREEDSLRVTDRKVSGKSKSLVFHD